MRLTESFQKVARPIKRWWAHYNLQKASKEASKTGTKVDTLGINISMLGGLSMPRGYLLGANLPGGNFEAANLTKANLEVANLTRANFVGADLRWANFIGATTWRTNFIKANLHQSKLPIEVFFDSENWKKAHNLDSVTFYTKKGEEVEGLSLDKNGNISIAPKPENKADNKSNTFQTSASSKTSTHILDCVAMIRDGNALTEAIASHNKKKIGRITMSAKLG